MSANALTGQHSENLETFLRLNRVADKLHRGNPNYKIRRSMDISSEDLWIGNTHENTEAFVRALLDNDVVGAELLRTMPVKMVYGLSSMVISLSPASPSPPATSSKQSPPSQYTSLIPDRSSPGNRPRGWARSRRCGGILPCGSCNA
jgi:hypothetical protein